MTVSAVLLMLTVLSASATEPKHPLKPDASWVIEPPGDDLGARFDPSGLVVDDGALFVVSDKEDFPDLYRLVEDGSGLRAEVALHGLAARHTDYEGLARCGSEWWVAVEDGSYILRRPSVEYGVVGPLPPIFLDLSTRPEGVPRRWGNKGLEGVACTPEGRVFVAKEREPRWLFEVDRGSGALTQLWDGAETAEAMEWGPGVAPDFSDLHHQGGFLYVLERGRRGVVKLDVSQPGRAIKVDWLPLELVESELYDYDEPYGMAEGLFVGSEHIWILLDNNGDVLKSSGRPQATLLRYPRPTEF